MNVFHKVTLQSLKKNKTRTVVTIIGIMLSAAMICAVTTTYASLQNFLYRNFAYSEGEWHGSYANANREELDFLLNSEEVEDVTYTAAVGYAMAGDTRTKETKPYLYIIGTEPDFPNSIPVHITAGRYPENADEIMLPEHYLNLGGEYYAPGEQIMLEIGDRVSGEWILGSDTRFIGSDPNQDEYETLVVRETKTYTVVGYCEALPIEDYSIGAAFYCLTIAEKTDNAAAYDAWFMLKNPKDIYSFMSANEIVGDTNDDILIVLGVSRFNAFYGVLYGLVGIAIALIMFGSVSLIYNAFSISVSERTKQFGLLSSIGATKQQLRRMVFFEAFSVSVIGIPLGILVGITGIGITLLCIGDRFAYMFDLQYPMRLCVSVPSVIAACIIALITVLFSAWIPSKRAMRVSAVEAIRQNNDITVSGKTVKISPLTYKLFGLPGMIARKHFKRNRKKYRTTVMSLFMSIVLFVSASSLTSYLVDSTSDVYSNYGFDILYGLDPSDERSIPVDEFMEKVRENETITEAVYTQRDHLNCNILREYLTDEWMYDVVRGMSGAATNTDDETLDFLAPIAYFVEDEVYFAYLKANGLNTERYMNPSDPVAVAIDGRTKYSTKQEKFIRVNTLKTVPCEMTAGFITGVDGYYLSEIAMDVSGNNIYRYRANSGGEDFIELAEQDAVSQVTVKVGAVLYERPYYISTEADLFLLYPFSARNAVIPENQTDNSYAVVMNTTNHNDAMIEMEKLLGDLGMSKSELYDYAASEEQDRAMVTVIEVFATGFIVLISLIAAANVFNTISTNIGLRRREFAMLKSVGMTAKGFNRMMNYECLLYGTKALLYGIPVSCVVTYFIYRTVSGGYDAPFQLPWAAMGIAVLSVFIVVSATMMYSMSKVRRENPIDALRNENL